MGEVKFYKSLDEKISDDKFKAEFGNGIISFVSWSRILPYIEHAIGKKITEKVGGIKVDQKGISVKFEKNENRR